MTANSHQNFCLKEIMTILQNSSEIFTFIRHLSSSCQVFLKVCLREFAFINYLLKICWAVKEKERRKKSNDIFHEWKSYSNGIIYCWLDKFGKCNVKNVWFRNHSIFFLSSCFVALQLLGKHFTIEIKLSIYFDTFYSLIKNVF